MADKRGGKRGRSHWLQSSRFRIFYGFLGLLWLLIAGTLAGCGKVDPSEAPPAADADRASDPFYQAFLEDREKPAAAGNATLEGQIFWQGEPPRGDKTWLAPLSPLIEKRNTPVEARKNPFFPQIDTKSQDSKGVAGVIVALMEGPVRPEADWPHGPLKVVLRNHSLVLEQDQGAHAVGIIRPEDSIAIELESGDFDTIRGRGAAFFALPFLKPKDAAARPPKRPGIIRLASGAGHFWMQGLIIASPTPLIGRTAQDGKFRITGIPPGEWTLVCFRPNQMEKARERDGETLETYLLDFREPIVSRMAVRIGPTQAPLRIGADDLGFSLVK